MSYFRSYFYAFAQTSTKFPYINLDEKKKSQVPIFCIFKIAEKIQKIVTFGWLFLFDNNLRNACVSLYKRIKVYSKNASFWLLQKLLLLIKCPIFDHTFMLLHRLAPGFPILIWTMKNHQKVNVFCVHIGCFVDPKSAQEPTVRMFWKQKNTIRLFYLTTIYTLRKRNKNKLKQQKA